MKTSLWRSPFLPIALLLAFSFQVASAAQGTESRLLSNIRQLTFEGLRAGEGYFNPDGSMLIFQSEREPGNPFFQIYLMDLKTGDTRRVSPGFGKTTCGWIHPNQSRLLFASTHEDPEARLKQEEELELRASGNAGRYSWDYDEYFDIFEGDFEGGNLKNLTQARGYDAEGSWSPDGNLIVFSSNRHAYSEKLSPQDQNIFETDKSYLVDLYLMNADGSEVRRLTDSPGYDGGPFFSPDGQEIVWRRFSEDGTTAEIFTRKLDGSPEKQMTRLGAMSWAPYFHPSGDYLIFATNLHGFENFELYLVDEEGRSEPVRVTSREGFDGLPVFHPDGRQLVWTSTATGNGRSQLFTARWDDGEARRLLGLDGVVQIAGAGRDATETLEVFPDLEDTRPEIRAQDLRLHVSYLASDQTEGRLTGTQGAQRATDYVASAFQFLGLEPAGDDGTYFQSFEFTSGVSLGPENHMSETGKSSGDEFVVDQDWRPLAFSKSGRINAAGIAFAGYGIVAPATQEHDEYDSYAHLDISDKWVLVFRYLPEEISPEFRQHLSRYSSLRFKAMTARDRGARGIMVVSGPNSQVKEELVGLSFDSSQAGTSIGVISVTDAFGEQQLESVGESLIHLQDQLDTGQSVMGFEIPGLELEVEIDIQKEKRLGRNVLARLRSGGQPDDAVVVGAHVDHLGYGRGAGSLAREEERGLIHYGADDNASGVGAVLEIAQYLVNRQAQSELPMKRNLLFAAWSGEELGLLGSSYFVQDLLEKTNSSTLTSQIAAYLNMDMIGRLRESLVLQGVGSSSVWPGEAERRNVPIGLPIVIQNDSYLPTDATSFYLRGVPLLSAFTGVHEDYHTPRDTADKINYEGAEKIARFMALITSSLLTSESAPDYVEMERPGSSAGRTALRAYLGTIPDYSQGDVAGVKLSGVMKGAPAEQAGIQGGDVVIEVAGQKIENIYDYTYAIDALKVGTAVKIVVLRGTQRVTVTVTPTSRE
jgi:Tol biopolymer transport system component